MRKLYLRMELLITKKTKKIIRAIIIVHVFGFPCEVEKLVKLCKKKKY